MCLAIGNGLPDSIAKLQPILDAIPYFLYEDTVAAKLVTMIQELVRCVVVDVVAIHEKLQRGCLLLERF